MNLRLGWSLLVCPAVMAFSSVCPAAAPEATDVAGEGGFLWIYRKVETTFRFMDWQKKG